MDFLYFLESIRTPFLDGVMSVITHLGSEIGFMVVALIIFWCVDKQRGYYILAVGFIGTVINQLLKLTFRIPRPWVQDPNFTIVEAARAEATGYSFPSGHTQNAVTYLGGSARAFKNKILRIVLIVIALLVAFSRMYLGVHTLLDVGVSLVIGTVLVFALYPIFKKSGENPKFIYTFLTSMLAVITAYTLFVNLYPWPADIDAHNLASGIKNGWNLLGATAGILIACVLDNKYIRFETKAPLPAQIIKVVIGLGLSLGVKEGLKAPLNALFNGAGAAHAVRYCLMVLVAAAVWPAAFKFINRLFEKKA